MVVLLATVFSRMKLDASPLLCCTDHASAIFVVIAFLVVVCGVGMMAGKGARSFRDYCIMDLRDSMPILLCTILSAELGGAVTVGVNVSSTGINLLGSGVSLIFLGVALSFALIGRFISPYFDNRFKNMLCLSNIIREFYGDKAEVFVLYLSVFAGVLAISGQFIAIAHLFDTLFGFNRRTTVLVLFLVVGSYSIFGGIRSVVATSIIHSIAILLIFPVIALMSSRLVNNYDVLLQQIHTCDMEVLKANLLTALYYSFPVYFLNPVNIQRLLMAKESVYIKRSLYNASVFFAVLSVVVCLVELSINIILPGGDRNLLHILLAELLYGNDVLIGICIVSVLAVIISAATSLLNALSVMMAVKRIRYDSECDELGTARYMTTLLCFACCMVGMLEINMVNLLILSISIVVVRSVAVFFAIVGFHVSSEEFWFSTILTILVIWSTLDILDIRFMPVISCLTALGAFAFMHSIKYLYVWQSYIRYGRDAELDESYFANLMSDCSLFITLKDYFFISLPRKLYNLLVELLNPLVLMLSLKTGMREFILNRLALSLFIAIYYVSSACFSIDASGVSNLHVLYIKGLCAVLSISLLLEFYFAEFSYFIYYRLCVFSFCLPFSSVLIYLLDGHSGLNLINLGVSFMLLSVLVSIQHFMLLASIGISAAVMCSQFFVTDINGVAGYYPLVYTILYSSIIGFIFIKKGYSVARNLHWLHYFTYFINSENSAALAAMRYDVSKLSDLTKQLDVDGAGRLHQRLNSIASELSYCSFKMHRLLERIRSDIDLGIARNHSMRDILNSVISSIYFSTGLDGKILVNAPVKNDFFVRCNDQLIINLIWFIIDNAIRHAFKRKDAILIMTMRDGGIEFEDTGIGMSNTVRNKAFDRFFSACGGIGLGLSYCKLVMKSIGGDISCKSTPDRGSTFFVYFGESIVRSQDEVEVSYSPSMLEDGGDYDKER